MSRKARLEVGGVSVELPVVDGTAGPSAVDATSVYKKTGYFMHDPGFFSTTSCSSAITFIDGERGILAYRGRRVEDLVKDGKSFEDIIQLLMFGEFLDSGASSEFSRKILDGMVLHEQVRKVILSFDKSAHPMAVLIACFASVAGMFHERFDKSDINDKMDLCCIAISQVAVFVAMIACRRNGLEMLCGKHGSDYCTRFLHMMRPGSKYTDDLVRALEVIFILHADHEQNASTSSMRLTGSTGADVFACLASAVSALWGPAHGGANEAVIKMLEDIEVDFGGDVEKFINEIKSPDSSRRLMGFGHRVYKNYDPRSVVLKKICSDVVGSRGTGNDSLLFNLALRLEKIALEDEYFIARKLYPNVDFYSGLILRALDIDTEMFTLLFALSRTSGWVAQWYEMVKGKFKIWRPRQLYVGEVG